MGDDRAPNFDDRQKYLFAGRIRTHGDGEAGGFAALDTLSDIRPRRESSVGALAPKRDRKREAPAQEALSPSTAPDCFKLKAPEVESSAAGGALLPICECAGPFQREVSSFRLVRQRASNIVGLLSSCQNAAAEAEKSQRTEK
jgi:hypothetical protein